MTSWQAAASATMIGSMPHRDRSRVIDFVLDQLPEIPAWPQLSVYPAEQMMAQYLEGFPGVRTVEGRTFVDTASPEFESELYSFYEEYLEVEAGTADLRESRFRFGPETGRSFYAFLEAIQRRGVQPKALKGQVVGPFTLLSSLKDPLDRALLYDDRFKDIAAKHLAMKARWQAGRLGAPGRQVILFIDEPALAGFGSSAFISVTADLVLELLKEVVDAIHDSGALAGIHICANTDWLLAFRSGVDIINLDAYNYLDKFALYSGAFGEYIEAGGTVAWGMVPTLDRDAAAREDAGRLADRWTESVTGLVSAQVTPGRILSQSLFTPSCGCSGLPEELAERVLKTTRELSILMKSRI